MTLKDKAEALLTLLCTCISEFTSENPLFVEDCKCFNAQKEDFCCNSGIYWGGIVPSCNGAFVTFVGAEVDEVSRTPCGVRYLSAFQVGVTLCEPAADDKPTLKAQYADCLLQLAETVQNCLAAAMCDKTIDSVSGVRASEGGFYFDVTI